MTPKFELCAGSLADCLTAQKYGADRIELNSALSAGGLTPSIASLRCAKQYCTIPVICMVRPREAGFCFNAAEAHIMFEDAKALLANGADGIAFGFLNEDGSIHEEYTGKMVELIHAHHGEAVFHRAVDVTPDLDKAFCTLIDLGVDRVLTSAQRACAPEGADLLRYLNEAYGQRIQILPGAGINPDNAADLLRQTGLNQVHSSCKAYVKDPTTAHGDVSYAVYSGTNELAYIQADPKLVSAMQEVLDKYGASLKK